jgi:DNA-binding MarR family transcriptional regulator
MTVDGKLLDQSSIGPYVVCEMGGVRREIWQTKPFPSLADEGVVTLLATADRLRWALAAVVGPHGLTGQQYNVLRILRGAGPQGLPTLDIAGRMVEHSPGITRLLERLEKKRLVRRQRCPRDGRRVLCFLTSAGARLLTTLDRPVSETGSRLVGPLGPARTRALIRLLDAVRARASRLLPRSSASADEGAIIAE